jgi:hypothetical protein
MPVVKKLVRKSVAAVEPEVEEEEIPVDPDDEVEEEEEEEEEEAEEEEEEEAEEEEEEEEEVAKPVKKVVGKPVAKAVAKPVAKAVAKPVAKAVAKPVAKAVAKPVAKAVVGKPVAKVAKVAKPVAKVKASALINIGGKTNAPTSSFELTVGEDVLQVPGEAPAEIGGRISREAVESAVHAVLVTRNIFPPETAKRDTAKVLRAVEETLGAIVSQFNFKFMSGMFKVRVIKERYYRPISEGRLGSLMPEHYRVKFDINPGGIHAQKGLLDENDEFVEQKAKAKKVKK